LRFSVSVTEDSLIRPYGKTAQMLIYIGPPDQMSQFFTFWAGSISLRIFSASTRINRIFHVPGIAKVFPYNNPVIEDGHMLSSLSAPGSVQKRVFKDDTNTVTVSTHAKTFTQQAMELQYPISDNQWIDVNVPFYVTYERLVTNGLYFGHAGVVVVEFETDDSTDKDTPYIPYVYASVGDDFRYSVWRPPINTLFGPRFTGGFPAVTTGRTVDYNGFYYTN